MKARRIKQSDFPQLLELCKEHASYEDKAIIEGDQLERWRSAFFADEPSLFGWVCESDEPTSDRLSGYMTALISVFTWSARPYLFLECLYLRPEARRSGLGRAMMALLTEFARSRDCHEIQWQTMPCNQSAIAFYRSLGAGDEPKIRFSLPLK